MAGSQDQFGGANTNDMSLQSAEVQLAHRQRETPSTPSAKEDTGPWRMVVGPSDVTLYSDDFTHDVAITISGDFAEVKQRVDYAQSVMDRLSTRPTTGLTCEYGEHPPRLVSTQRDTEFDVDQWLRLKDATAVLLITEWLQRWWKRGPGWRNIQRAQLGPDTAQLMRGVADYIEQPMEAPPSAIAPIVCRGCTGREQELCLDKDRCQRTFPL